MSLSGKLQRAIVQCAKCARVPYDTPEPYAAPLTLSNPNPGLRPGWVELPNYDCNALTCSEHSAPVMSADVHIDERLLAEGQRVLVFDSAPWLSQRTRDVLLVGGLVAAGAAAGTLLAEALVWALHASGWAP